MLATDVNDKEVNQIDGLRSDSIDIMMSQLTHYALALRSQRATAGSTIRYLGVYPFDYFSSGLLTTCVNGDATTAGATTIPISAFCIVNTDPSTMPGKHWVAFFMASQAELEFFDSFGKSPEFYKFPIQGLKIRYAVHRLQSFTSRVCGHYALVFLFYRLLLCLFRKSIQRKSNPFLAEALTAISISHGKQISKEHFIVVHDFLLSQASSYRARDLSIVKLLANLMVLSKSYSFISSSMRASLIFPRQIIQTASSSIAAADTDEDEHE